ncbi:unnamed protein product [Clavelina lepadiformis]|uniref:AH domain-containing protein n=1 Tax=Clavelina lepadiformis TaxID=159417 RepID=A0ABP0G4U7_CLALP
MTEILNGTEIAAATSEISLNDEAYEKETNGIHANGGENNLEDDRETQDGQLDDSYPSSQPQTGDQTFIVGSSNVGSRLAGDSVGSRLASFGITAETQSRNDPNQSPAYKPAATTLSLNRSKSQSSVGFGSSTAPAPASSKFTNMTFQDVQQVAAVKADTLKTWSVKTYKCTKQILSEKLGRGTRTVDLELEAKVEILRDTKRKYENLMMLTNVLANHFSSLVQTQKVLSSAFGELSAKSQELQEEFRYNAETQIVLANNGENLLSAIKFFTSNVSTLCSKTMEDTLITISRYEAARLQFDAYRSELETLNLAPRTEANILKQAASQQQFNKQKSIYDKLRDDVNVKLQFLDENRVKVMQKNLLLFHNAISAYFAGNQQQLAAALEQFNIPKPTQSFIEKD